MTDPSLGEYKMMCFQIAKLELVSGHKLADAVEELGVQVGVEGKTSVLYTFSLPFGMRVT